MRATQGRHQDGTGGAPVEAIETTVGQRSLRAVPDFCNARQMTAPQASIQFSPEGSTSDGEVRDGSTRAFLPDGLTGLADHVERVPTVRPCR